MDHSVTPPVVQSDETKDGEIGGPKPANWKPCPFFKLLNLGRSMTERQHATPQGHQAKGKERESKLRTRMQLIAGQHFHAGRLLQPERIVHHARRNTRLASQFDAAAGGEVAADDGLLRRAGGDDVIEDVVHDVLVEKRRIAP